eukprot:GHVU01133679.1.p1 GENE.GHVU01133679.1~~GHVU01133679.1.p1  ORF type:complete len:225 (+),score=64.36 GHVU01133679.1:1220-1894(+)
MNTVKSISMMNLGPERPEEERKQETTGPKMRRHRRPVSMPGMYSRLVGGALVLLLVLLPLQLQYSSGVAVSSGRRGRASEVAEPGATVRERDIKTVASNHEEESAGEDDDEKLKEKGEAKEEETIEAKKETDGEEEESVTTPEAGDKEKGDKTTENEDEEEKPTAQATETGKPKEKEAKAEQKEGRKKEAKEGTKQKGEKGKDDGAESHIPLVQAKNGRLTVKM